MSSRYHFRSLDPAIRALMRLEVEADIDDGVLVMSKNFNSRGHDTYADRLLEAVDGHDEAWLATQIADCFAPVTSKGRKVRKDAHIMFAGNEFNRFYIRAVCCRAVQVPGSKVRIYRARHSHSSRSESDAKIGTYVDPTSTLEDLRARVGTDPKGGLPLIFSGLSVELVHH